MPAERAIARPKPRRWGTGEVRWEQAGAFVALYPVECRALAWDVDPSTGSSEEFVVRDKVAEVIEVVRPAIQADGGDITLLDVDEAAGIVTVELSGACVSCPASTVTLKAGIERIMKDRVPGVTEVRQPGEDLVETGTTVSL